jgi:hypothetical protein
MKAQKEVLCINHLHISHELYASHSIVCPYTIIPWLRHFVARLSMQRTRFYPRPLCVGFMLSRVALGLVFPQVLWFSPSLSLCWWAIFIHLCIIDVSVVYTVLLNHTLKIFRLAIMFTCMLVIITLIGSRCFWLFLIYAKSDGGEYNSRQTVTSLKYQHPHHPWDFFLSPQYR